MSEWKVLGQHDGYKVRLGGKGLLIINDEVFTQLNPPQFATEVVLEALVNGEPRTFALRCATTGDRILFRKVTRKGGAMVWNGTVCAVAEEVGLTAYRGEVIDTEWRIENDMLIVRVPLSFIERQRMDDEDKS